MRKVQKCVSISEPVKLGGGVGSFSEGKICRANSNHSNPVIVISCRKKGPFCESMKYPDTI